MASNILWLLRMNIAERLASLRKQKGLTQQALADALGLHVTQIKRCVSIDELLGENAKSTSAKRGPASRLQQQIEQTRQLPRSQQSFVSKMLETVIQHAS